MAVVRYNRPISKVGFRILNQTNPQAAAALGGFSPTYGGLGQISSSDSATLANNGFTSAQISQIFASYNAGALSATGYNELLMGTVAPGELSQFLNYDVGAPTDTSSWFTDPTQALITGVPNWSLVALGGVVLMAIVLAGKK
jgi:hypothetical protein